MGLAAAGIAGGTLMRPFRWELVPPDADLVVINAKVYTMDGVSVEYPDWHFNVRASNTEPLIRLNLEATTQSEMERRRDEVLAFIRS